MRTLEAYAALGRAERLARLRGAPGALAAAVGSARAEALARRPAPGAWAAVEVLCHLRDLEESFLERLRLIALVHEPRFPTTSPDRWAEERQYLRHDAGEALAAFTRRRGETLAFLDGLAPAAWARAGFQLDSRGRRTVDDFVAVMAWHDDNHLAQLRRALAGRP
ncbi:MAG TPA: DinB family protein [Methylomirabilota bacterium]|nr:DinB family protein [Methylomirabilota bacterium]